MNKTILLITLLLSASATFVCAEAEYDCSEELSAAYDNYSAGVDFENRGVELWNLLDSIKDKSLCAKLKDVLEKSSKASEKYAKSKTAFAIGIKRCTEKKSIAYAQNFVKAIGDREKANGEMSKKAKDDITKKRCP